jgi:hypothetical protein
MVGRNPRKSMTVISTMAVKGLFVKNHRRRAKAAPARFNLSTVVMCFSPRWRANRKTIVETMAVTRVTHAPAPPPALIWPAKAIAVSAAHTNGEYIPEVEGIASQGHEYREDSDDYFEVHAVMIPKNASFDGEVSNADRGKYKHRLELHLYD